jgi:hypothetical protein
VLRGADDAQQGAESQLPATGSAGTHQVVRSVLESAFRQVQLQLIVRLVYAEVLRARGRAGSHGGWGAPRERARASCQGSAARA